MLTEGLLDPGSSELHLLLSEFFEEIKKDVRVIEIIEGKTSEKFEKYRSRILKIFSNYNWLSLMRCIKPEDKVWRSIKYFYSDILKLLIDKCEDKTSIQIMFNEAVDLQAELTSRLPKNSDFYSEDFCWEFSLNFVCRFAGAK